MPFATSHPLARQIHFHVVLFGLNVLRFTTILNYAEKWKLKDMILSSALSWFSSAPKYVHSTALPVHRSFLTGADGRTAATDYMSFPKHTCLQMSRARYAAQNLSESMPLGRWLPWRQSRISCFSFLVASRLDYWYGCILRLKRDGTTFHLAKESFRKK